MPLQKNATSSLRSGVERLAHDEYKKTVFQSSRNAGLFLLLADPRFYPLVFQHTVMSYSSIIFRSVTVDYARDKGVPLGHAELMGTYCAATDLLLGHMALPFLADRRFVNRTLLVAITFALLSATLFALTVSQGLVFFLSFFAAMSILVSATASFSPVLITDYLGPRRVPITWGASGLLTSPLLLVTPSITEFVLGLADSQGA
ncbi:hypothetical protein HPB49_004913 [Dermacentor silvarum]|uniref:Uncharacterized protein n=1 Tax=Dermacentor silvarum TaxID=543639 RepID=A0ACB8D3C5_DERSI|nr:hypothetical protein HPB49_004913 [Dermacentor silvarum]